MTSEATASFNSTALRVKSTLVYCKAGGAKSTLTYYKAGGVRPYSLQFRRNIMINSVIGALGDGLYSYVLIFLLVGGGIYFTARGRGAQVALLGEQIRCVKEKPAREGEVSSLGALIVSTASRVGTGNIIGVSTAICLGGYGAVFWMWIIAVIGSASAFVESTLAQIYKRRGKNGDSYGGPAYYIESTLGSRGLAVTFSVLLMLTYGFGFNMLTSYNMQSTLSPYGFYSPALTPWLIGLLLAGAVFYCLIGGGDRVMKITGGLVPTMGIAYILVAAVIVLLNIGQLGGVLRRIFTDAFSFSSVSGGVGGAAMVYGIKRGLFSNEAGVGSAPNASAAASVNHPVKQGLVQVLSVFIDTLLVCTATAFMCLCSGIEPTAELSGAPYVQQSLERVLGAGGPVFITVAMFLFGFTTLLGNLYYTTGALSHILRKPPRGKLEVLYYLAASAVIFIGAGLSADLLWGIADVTMGLMALINMPVILYLGKYAFRALEDYRRKRKAGVTPEFRSESIGLPHKVDFWN